MALSRAHLSLCSRCHSAPVPATGRAASGRTCRSVSKTKTVRDLIHYDPPLLSHRLSRFNRTKRFEIRTKGFTCKKEQRQAVTEVKPNFSRFDFETRGAVHKFLHSMPVRALCLALRNILCGERVFKMPQPEQPVKNANAVELGRLGARARALKLSPRERKRIATVAAQARWGKRRRKGSAKP